MAIEMHGMISPQEGGFDGKTLGFFEFYEFLLIFSVFSGTICWGDRGNVYMIVGNQTLEGKVNIWLFLTKNIKIFTVFRLSDIENRPPVACNSKKRENWRGRWEKRDGTGGDPEEARFQGPPATTGAVDGGVII